MTVTERPTDRRVGHGRLRDSPVRPDGIPKAQGTFAFSSDLPIAGAAWGATLRSPHPHARVRSLDASAAWDVPGVAAVITADDVPGQATYGLIAADQPVFARDVVRYVGEPVAAVAADHPETCRRALAAIRVEYEVLEPRSTPRRPRTRRRRPIHPSGNVLRHQRIVAGDPHATGEVVVEGTYELGMQDQAFLGLEAAVAVPADDGRSVDLHVATHDDGYEPDMILAIARGGLLIGGALGYTLSVKNVYTMNVEFYVGVDERLEVPRILPPAPDFVDLHDARILIVDDVADTGHTLKSVEVFCAGKVGEVRTAVIYEKSHSVVKCDYVWRRTDMWINFPWSDKPPVAKRKWSVADA